MSDHKYRQETQAKEVDQPPKADSLYEWTEESTGYREQVLYRRESKVKVTDQTKNTDIVYESAEETGKYHVLG